MLPLDNPSEIRKYDVSGMLALLDSFSKQCKAAKDIGTAYSLPLSFKRKYKNIVCIGLGGSAIGADIIRSYLTDEIKTPIFINRNYRLPEFVDEDSLVIASSYSGDTEETLSAYEDANAKNAKVVAITSGGKLKDMADRDEAPSIMIPKGLPPRCALGYSSIPLLILLSKVGLIRDKSRDIESTIKLLNLLREERIGHKVDQKKNMAKDIAQKLYLKYPVIYGAEDHIDAVLTRWRGQLAENSKTLSSGGVFPEMTHNEIVGWENPKKVLKDFAVLILRDSGDHPRISKRMDIIKKILVGMKISVIEVASIGEGLLSRIFSLVYIGDYVSYYLAILNRLDPTPVERITYLKERLAKN